MENGVFQINNYEMEDVGSFLGETSANSGEVVNDSKKKFANSKKQNLFAEGATAIEEKIQYLSDSLESAKRAIIKGNEAASQLETRMADEAASIEIPNKSIFALNGNDNFSEFRSIYLDKKDGTSVNDGVASSAVNMDDIDEVTREDLKDINKNYSGEVREIDNYTVAKENMVNINNGDETTQKDLNFRNVVNGTTLNEMNGSALNQGEIAIDAPNLNAVNLQSIPSGSNLSDEIVNVEENIQAESQGLEG